MKGISHCLFVTSGIIVVLESGEKKDIMESAFELKTGDEGLFFQNAEVSIPFTAKIVEHLLATEEGNIYIYDGENSLSLNHLATVNVDKNMRLRAHGALWVLENQTAGAAVNKPVHQDELAGDSVHQLYPGLKIPPELKKGPIEAKEAAVAAG